MPIRKKKAAKKSPPSKPLFDSPSQKTKPTLTPEQAAQIKTLTDQEKEQHAAAKALLAANLPHLATPSFPRT